MYFKNKDLSYFNMVSFDFTLYFILVTLGYVFGVYVSYKRILQNHGPDSNSIRKIKFNHDNKCYKFKPIIKPCNE